MILSVSWGTQELDGEAKTEGKKEEASGRENGSGSGENGKEIPPEATGKKASRNRKGERSLQEEVNEPEFEING
jgi:hypothetical protein